MYQIDFHKPLSIHFIGIGGISMSGLAEILLEEGFTISGSDSQQKPPDQSSGKQRCKDLRWSARFQYFRFCSGCCLYSCHPSGQPGIRLREGKRSPYADKSPASDRSCVTTILLSQLPVHMERPQPLLCRHTFSEGRMRPDDQCRRYPSCNWRQYPCRTVRDLPDRSM